MPKNIAATIRGNMIKNLVSVLIFVIAVFSFGCAKSNSANQNHPQIESTTEVLAQEPSQSEEVVQDSVTVSKVLLFNGLGTSVSDWQTLEGIIRNMGLTYKLVNSAALNAMSTAELIQYKLILIPGGNSNVIINNLTLATKIKVRKAVRDSGVSFLGICAGAFAAVGIDTYSNTTAYYGFAVAQGDYLPHWYPGGNSTLITSIQKINFATGNSRFMTWWDGPSVTDWKAGVIARYPDGKAAISQTWTGKGFVIVSGIHPEAPKSWQYDTGVDPDGTDYDIAIQLISAALNRKPLPAFN